MGWQDEWIWWKRGIIYQVYPRSFQDTDGDGCGDLAGIIGRLDYLSWLGVEAVWISPIFPSPMKDFGYDISDYTGIHPLFGSMSDFDALLEAAHAKEMRVILDLVPNHTSDQHPWFLASSRSRDDPKRDWYLWSDPGPDGGPPNNWLSEFGGSAWEWHQPTGQYYYHAFAPEQPDLNWRNRDVREAMYEVMRFWLDKGVDGFRVDVMWHLMKDEQLRSNPPNTEYDPELDSPYRGVLPVYSVDQPEVHEVVREMRLVVDEYDKRLIIGEIYLPIDSLVAYYGNEEERGAHLPFNFQLIGAPWDAGHIREVTDTYESSLPEHGWPNWVLGNHDQPRLATRVGSEQARIAAMLLLTLRGTPTLYYGDEIGMVDVEIPPERQVDPRGLNAPGKGLSRDPERTPMQWTGEQPNAGFTDGTPWLPVAEDYGTRNVSSERRDPESILSLYRGLIQLRQAEPALAVGSYEPVVADPPLHAYLRRHEDDAFLVVLNFDDSPQTYEPPPGADVGEVAISTHEATTADRKTGETIEIRPNEGLVIRLSAPPRPHPRSTIDGAPPRDD